jgi:hypothetical protein
MIFDVKCETGISTCVEATLFEYLKRLGRDVVTRLLNIISDNGSDAKAAVAHLFQLVNTFIRYKHMHKVNHIRCTNHSVQLDVLKVLTFIKEPTEQLQDALIRIHRNKVMRQRYCIKSHGSQACQQGADTPRLAHALELDSRDVHRRFWTSMWPTLATALSLTWNGMPSMTCRRSFARRAKSWRALRVITSQRST